MSVKVSELKSWLNGLDENNRVAIDDGGLTVVELDVDGKPTGSAAEIGGVPVVGSPVTWVIVVGNPVDGFQHYGPFKTQQQATDWATCEWTDGTTSGADSWWLAQLLATD